MHLPPTVPNISAPPATFLQHLVRACAVPIDESVFLEGYAGSLAGVAAHQSFELFGLTVEAPAGVYSPHETSSTRFLLSHFFSLGLDVPRGRLLEVGCGAGAISMMAARKGWEVVATDIDPAAVDATRRNALRNDVDLRVLESDLFAALGDEAFDVIVFNQPFFHVGRDIQSNETTLSNPDGSLHARFLAEAGGHLKPGGYVVFTFSNCSNSEALNQPGWELELRAFDFGAGAGYLRAAFVAKPV